MRIATPTFDDDAFLHAGGRIRRWSEETVEVPALTPDSTFRVRLEHRRHAYRRVVAIVLGVLALLAIAGVIVGWAASAPAAERTIRASVVEVTPLLDAKRTVAPHRRRVRRGR
jgi:hypothetical protein